MPTAFLRSPADSLAGVTAKDKVRAKRTRGGLLQEDRDQDFGWAEGRTGPQGSAPNMRQNRDITMGSGNVRPQDTKVGTVDDVPAATGDVGMAPSTRDMAGSTYPPSTADRPVPMSDGEVQSALQKMVWDAIEYVDQELSPQRAEAAKYYAGEPFGNEEEGRSQVVITTLRDTVLMIMPSLMRIFFSMIRPIEYEAQDMDAVEWAKQITEFVWEGVVKRDNRGALVFYEWFKDALVKKLGIVKCWYDDAAETKTFTTSYLDEDALTLLQDDPTIRVDEIRPSKGTPPGAVLFDVVYTQTKSEGKIRFITLPPEEYIFTRGSRTTSADRGQPGVALFVGHRTELTRSQLLEIGVSPEDIEEWAFKDVSLDHNQEEIQRQHIVKPDTSAIGPIATQKALYIEGYPYLDANGDGIAELRRVIMLGPGYHVIANEPCARRPFAVICPDPEPHTIVGQGAGDWTMDLQLIQSMIWRSMNDSLALTLHPRMGYVEGEVNLEDVLNVEIGAPIRMRSPNALQPIEHQFVGQAALPVLEKLDEIRENRTGITKASAGLDADALQSTTKTAAAASITAAQQHIELIARMFAETGVAELFVMILELLVANQPTDRIVKMRGEYVPMDPRAWDASLKVAVRIALGAGLDDQKYAALAEQAQKMEMIFQTMGLANPIVTPRQYRDVLVEMLKLRGREDAERFYQEVDPNWQPPPPPAQDPNMVIAQAEQMKAQAHVQKQAADTQLDAEKHQVETMRRAEDLELRRQQMMLEDAREREKMAMELALREKEIALAHQREVRESELKAEVQREATRINAQVKRDTAVTAQPED